MKTSFRHALITHFLPQWILLLTATVFAMGTALLGIGYLRVLNFLGHSLQIKIIEDTQSTMWIGWPILSIVLLSLGRASCVYLMTILNNIAVQNGLVSIQNQQFGAIVDAEYLHVIKYDSGRLVSRFINDINTLRDTVLRLANNFTKSVLTLIGILIWLFLLDWQLAIIIVFVYPIALGPVLRLGERIRKNAKLAQDQIGEVTSLLSQAFLLIRFIKAFALESYEKQRARQSFENRSRLFLKVLRQRASVEPILECVGGIAMAGIFGFSIYRINSGHADLGDLLGVIGALLMAAPEVRALGSLSTVFQEGKAAMERVMEIATLPSDKKISTTTNIPLSHAVRSIVFDGVCFSYPGFRKALHNVSFTITQGERVAFVGPSGSGKTTIINLLLRLFDPVSGSISVDGVDIRAYTPDSLRRSMSLVSQDSVLFNDTIVNNIRIGRPDADDQAIQDVAQRAGILDFTAEFENGLQMCCGEMGRALSGGQRQRILIARALLRDRAILLLDEPTAALDAKSEAGVNKFLQQVSRDRITINIAHRLSTIVDYDKIIVLSSGTVMETGNHDTLLKQNGLYASMYHAQNG